MMVYLGKSVERDMYFGAKPELFRLALRMRFNPTEAEKVLWKQLKKFRKEGFIFRRQHPVDFFIADFYCHKIRLVIEVDGEIHQKEEAQKYDDNRSGELERFGIRVVRFSNEEVLNNQNLVLTKINKIIKETTVPLSPGRGGQEGVRLKDQRRETWIWSQTGESSR
jgi:very-short-patch-repair endonuclease